MKSNDAYTTRLHALAFIDRLLEPAKAKSHAQTAQSKKIRKKLHETRYETVAELAVHAIAQAKLLLYAYELFRGIVKREKETHVSHTVPNYESYSLPDMLLCLDLAGHDLNVKLVDHPKVIKLDHENFEDRPTDEDGDTDAAQAGASQESPQLVGTLHWQRAR